MEFNGTRSNMTAIKTYKVRVRIVPIGADAFDVWAPEVQAYNGFDADKAAEAAVRKDYREARAVVALHRKRVAV
jgi:hypothetical protein